MSSDSAPFAEGNFDPQELLEASEKFTTADALEIEADRSEPPEEVWGGLRLAPGQLMEVIGGSGLGKSRMMLNLAVCQVLGRTFAGLPTCQRPLNWLFYGNENSFYRYREDLRRMFSDLAADERERLRGHIFLPIMSDPRDAYISFIDENNRSKLKTTIQYRKADVVVFDPWGAVIDGDELDDGDVRKTLLEITDVLAAHKEKHTVGIILNHSRNGYKELADAVGASAANYGKNSKAIFTVVRNVWNLRPGHDDMPPTKIEMIHAKSSDARAYEPTAVDMDPKTFFYVCDPDFDHASWQHELERRKMNRSSLSPSQRNDVTKRQDEEMRQKILDFVTSKGTVSKSILKNWTLEQGMPVNRAQGAYNSLLTSGALVRVTEIKTGQHIVGTPNAISQMIEQSPPNTYRQEHRSI